MKPIIKNINNKLTQLTKIAEPDHYQTEFDKHKSNMKQMWQMIREIIGKKTSSQQSQEFLINGTLTRDGLLLADTFNEYFTTIGSELTKDIPTVTKKPEDYLDGVYKNSNVFSTYNHI